MLHQVQVIQQLNKIGFIIIIIYLLYHSLCWCLFVHQPGAYHAPGASDTQVIHSHHTLSTYPRIRADPSMLIFWVSVTLALSDTLLMFSTISFFIVPSAPTTTGITSVFICHILCISNSRSLCFFFILLLLLLWQLKRMDARTYIHERWASRTWPANMFKLYICTH